MVKELIKDCVGLYLDMAKDIVDLYSWLWKDNKDGKRVKLLKEQNNGNKGTED